MGRPRLRSCVICLDEGELSSGLECRATESHFTCRKCLGELVAAKAGEDVRLLEKREVRRMTHLWHIYLNIFQSISIYLK